MEDRNLGRFHRRDLLRHVATGTMAFTAVSYSRILRANDRIHLALIGCGGRGQRLLEEFQNNPPVLISSLCDVWGDRVNHAQQKATHATTFLDHRKLLEMKELHAVIIATPDHWHAALAIDAMDASKDVYVEKPLTLKISEGPEIVKAARAHDRICQVGMQRRSGPGYWEVKREYVDSGKIGKLLLFRSWWHKNPVHVIEAPASLKTKPANLDWDRYLGALKWREWDPQQFWNFRAFLDFGGGQVTDLFTHWVDVLHMFLGEDLPCAAVAAGGIYTYKDGRTAPDTIHVALEYPSGLIATFDGALAAPERTNGAEFMGTKGSLRVEAMRTQYRFEFRSGEAGAPPEVRVFEGEPTADHVRNFLECLRTRKRPTADVLAGHRAAQASHLGNIAYLKGKRLKFDPLREEIAF